MNPSFSQYQTIDPYILLARQIPFLFTPTYLIQIRLSNLVVLFPLYNHISKPLTSTQHVSSGEERRAHNPEVPGSKPGHAMSIFFFFFSLPSCFYFLHPFLSLFPMPLSFFISRRLISLYYCKFCSDMHPSPSPAYLTPPQKDLS